METDTVKTLAPIKSRITKMQSVVEALVIKDEESQKQATNILSGIKSIAKEIDAKKKEITKPMLLALSATRALFAPLEKQYNDAELTVKVKMLDYHQEQERMRIAEEARLAARVEKGTLKVETAARKLEAIPETQNHIDTGRGSMTVKKIKKFRITDMSKLPLRFHLANETAIRQRMNAGKPDLPGVEYFTEDSISAR